MSILQNYRGYADVNMKSYVGVDSVKGCADCGITLIILLLSSKRSDSVSPLSCSGVGLSVGRGKAESKLSSE